MKALIAIGTRRLGLTVLLTASICCVLTLASPGWSVAKTRPPVEMGDPDATGDRATIPGPGIAATKPTVTFAPPTGLRIEGWGWLRGVGLTVRSYLSLCFRGLL